MSEQAYELDPGEQGVRRAFLRAIVEQSSPEWRATLLAASADERSLLRTVAELAFITGRDTERARRDVLDAVRPGEGEMSEEWAPAPKPPRGPRWWLAGPVVDVMKTEEPR